MKLFVVLLIVIAILTTLSGLSIFAGANKKERATAGWFFLAAVGASAWAVAISLFLNLAPGKEDVAPILVAGIFAGSVLMDIALLGYTSWESKIGKILTIIFIVIGCSLVGIISYNPGLLYSSIELSYSGNIIYFLNDWCLWTYGGFIFVITMIFSGFLLFKIIRSRNKKMQRGMALFLGGLSITGTLSLLFDLILPVAARRCDLLWVGPLAIGVTMLTFYYTILHYRVLAVNTGWLKVLSFVILGTSGIALYMLVFYAIFAALFGMASPSWTIVMFNLIMIAIALLLTPAISELMASITSLINTRQINIAYVVKKMSRVTAKNTTLRELTNFLAGHLHFSYVGILANGKIYGSGPLMIDVEDLTKLAGAKNTKQSIWKTQKQNSEISLIAELKNSKGEVFGKMIFGKSDGRTVMTQKELAQIEMVANLTAAVIETEKFLKA